MSQHVEFLSLPDIYSIFKMFYIFHKKPDTF